VREVDYLFGATGVGASAASPAPQGWSRVSGAASVMPLPATGAPAA
jgi:hypothetical protein